jgi:hypothetical protein
LIEFAASGFILPSSLKDDPNFQLMSAQSSAKDSSVQLNNAPLKNGDTLYFPGYGAEKWKVDEIVMKDGKPESFKITNDKGFSDTIRGGPIFDRFVEANSSNGNLKMGGAVPFFGSAKEGWTINKVERDGNGVITKVVVTSSADGHQETLASGYAFDQAKKLDRIVDTAVPSTLVASKPTDAPVTPVVGPSLGNKGVIDDYSGYGTASTSTKSLRDEGMRQAADGSWKRAETLREFYDTQYFLDNGYMLWRNGVVVPNPDAVNTDRGRSFYNAGLLPAWGEMGPIYVLPGELNAQGIDKGSFADYYKSLSSTDSMKSLQTNASSKGMSVEDYLYRREANDATNAYINRPTSLAMPLKFANPAGAAPANTPMNTIYYNVYGDKATAGQALFDTTSKVLRGNLSAGTVPNQFTYGKDGPMYRTETELKKIEKQAETGPITYAPILADTAKIDRWTAERGAWAPNGLWFLPGDDWLTRSYTGDFNAFPISASPGWTRTWRNGNPYDWQVNLPLGPEAVDRLHINTSDSNPWGTLWYGGSVGTDPNLRVGDPSHIPGRGGGGTCSTCGSTSGNCSGGKCSRHARKMNNKISAKKIRKNRNDRPSKGISC